MTISIQLCFFFLFATLLIIAALMTVIARNPVRSALFLVLSFFSASILWILLEAEFLGLILILVYVGAVMTLFLFVIMMLNIDAAEKNHNFVSYLPYAIITLVVLLAILVYALLPISTPHKVFSQTVNISNTHLLGSSLYTDYAYPFEIVGVLLLVAIVASIALAGKTKKKFNKMISSEKQNKVKSVERLRIIKMESNKKI